MHTQHGFILIYVLSKHFINILYSFDTAIYLYYTVETDQSISVAVQLLYEKWRFFYACYLPYTNLYIT